MKPWIKYAAASLALGAFACSDPEFDRLQYRNISDAPGTADLRPRDIRIEKGIAIKALVSAIDDNGDTMELHALTSSNSQIFRVDPGPRAGEFVFSGVEVGTVHLDIDADRLLVSIPVEVVTPE